MAKEPASNALIGEGDGTVQESAVTEQQWRSMVEVLTTIYNYRQQE